MRAILPLRSRLWMLLYLKNWRNGRSLTNGRDDVNTFCIQGTMCRRIGSLLLLPDSTPKFPQIYIYDIDLDTAARTRCSIMDRLDLPTVRMIQCILQDVNDFIRLLRSAGLEICANENLVLRIMSLLGRICTGTIDCGLVKWLHWL